MKKTIWLPIVLFVLCTVIFSVVGWYFFRTPEEPVIEEPQFFDISDDGVVWESIIKEY